MRGLFVILSSLVVISLAYWVYNENYATQEKLREISTLQRDIGLQREELAVLKAEWAYLNRPDRLRNLAVINYDYLGLLPIAPEQFSSVDSIGAYVEKLEDSLGLSQGEVEGDERREGEVR